MAGTITEDELLNKARELGGEIGDAVKWMRRQGLTLVPNPIPPANRELPPVEPQGGLKTAEEASTMAADTGEEDTGTEDTGAEDTGAMGGLDYANVDFSQIKDNPGAFIKSFLDASRASDARRAASAKKLYEEADKRILEKYAGPSQSERLFALSRAMLSPTDFPGFKGFLGNITGALSENAKAAREAEQLRQQKQFENYLQYQKGELERGDAMAKTAADLVLKYAKPPSSGLIYDTRLGVFADRNNPRPTQEQYNLGKGRTLVLWQDNLWREKLPDGRYKVFERAGNQFNEIRIEGPR